MEVAVMCSAQRHREFVADLAPHRPRLGEPEMVRISGVSPADQTGLRRHELEMSFVAESPRLADREHAFVDFGGNGFGLKIRRTRMAQGALRQALTPDEAASAPPDSLWPKPPSASVDSTKPPRQRGRPRKVKGGRGRVIAWVVVAERHLMSPVRIEASRTLPTLTFDWCQSAANMCARNR